MNIRTAITAVLCVSIVSACSNGTASDKAPSSQQAAGETRTAATMSASPEKPVEDAGFVGYVVRAEGDRMLVVSPESRDFSANRGMSNFYEAVWFTNMPSGIGLGMKVEVWTENGEVLESYPAQGKAARAEVLDEAKPEGAAMSEPEAIRKMLASYELAGDGYPIIISAKYDPSSERWTVTMANNGEEDTSSVEVFDKEQEPDRGELYGLALNAFMPIDEGLNRGMQYIAVDMSHFENVDDIGKQQIVKALSGYNVPVKEATYEQLWAEEELEREPQSIALKGVLLRVDKVELSKKRMVLEGSKFKSGKGAIGAKIIVELTGGRWQVTKADGTWIS